MKRLMLLSVAGLLAAFYLGSGTAFALQGHGSGPGLSRGPSAINHDATKLPSPAGLLKPVEVDCA